jgi:hypothetical protein
VDGSTERRPPPGDSSQHNRSGACPVTRIHPLVHAVQVVRGAEAREVRRVVAPAVRLVDEVVRLRRRAAAARHLAPAAVAREDAAVRRAARLQRLLPRRDEVLGHPDEACFGREPGLGGLARGPAGRVEQRRDAAGDADVELAARGHLRLLGHVELAAERDAGGFLGADDQRLDRGVVGVLRDQPRLFI